MVVEPPPIRLALGFHLARRSLSTHRLITTLLVIAVAAAVGFQIPIDANLSGYHAALMNEGVSHGFGAVRVFPKQEHTIEESGAVAAKVAKYPEVSNATSVLTFPGSVRAGTRDINCAVRAVDGDRYFRLREGELLAPEDSSGVLIGTEFAQQLHIEVGDTIDVRVILELRPQLLDEDTLGRYRMKVRGIVEGAFGARDAVFFARGFLAEEAGIPDEAHSLAVYLHEPANAPAVRERVMAEFPEIEARTWRQDSAYLRSNLGAIDSISAVSVAMIIAAVSIPILALLYINVLYRRRDVGLMVAVGLGRAEIFLCYLLQAVAVALIGVSCGWVLGTGMLAWFSAYPIFAYEGFVIRPVPSVAAFVRPSLIVLATAAAAGAFPAWLASRIDPARVLRGAE